MLKKILKYDFIPVFKYWWIAALSMLLISIFSGMGLSTLISDRTYPALINIISTLGIFLVVLGYGAFSLLSAILVFARFYKNFFTDEGYLTFTLPVKHSTLLNSKIILYLVTSMATGFVIFLNLAFFILIGCSINPFSASSLQAISDSFLLITETIGGYLFVYILELIVFCLLSTLLSGLTIFACITFSSIVAKKGRIPIAIGIYYAINGVFSIIVRIFSFIILDYLSDHASFMTEQELLGTFALIALGAIFFTLVCCIGLYSLECWLLNDKLNLE